MSDNEDPEEKTYMLSEGGYGVEDPQEGVSRMPHEGEMGPSGNLVENAETGDQGVEDENAQASIPLPSDEE